MSDEHKEQVSTFIVEGVIFDMDGTLVDSISAVEAAWTKKAKELDIDAQKLIKDSHGRRVADMLKEVDPDLNDDNVDEKAQQFEQSTLDFADDSSADDDKTVKILPGVKALIDSLPKDKYAIATSGGKIYCHGCLKRVDLDVPQVCVTADDKRLEEGKPHPAPFLLAAKDLGLDPKKCVVFEDSPSGIKAALAAGCTAIAVCTSRKREKINQHGAHYVVDTMEKIKVEQLEDGQMKFTVTH